MALSASERVKRYQINHPELFYDKCSKCNGIKYIKSLFCLKCHNKLHVGIYRNDWKGDKVTYRVLHLWVQRWKGKPDTCEHCGKTGLSGRKIHWANVSHQYKRDLTDWIRLCARCHAKYDDNRGGKTIIQSALS